MSVLKPEPWEDDIDWRRVAYDLWDCAEEYWRELTDCGRHLDAKRITMQEFAERYRRKPQAWIGTNTESSQGGSKR